MIWFLVYIFSAFFWFCWAFGFIQYAPWVVPAAFVYLGVGMLFSAMKSLVEWADKSK